MVDHLPVQPAAKGVHQGLGALEVVEGYQGLDVLFQQVVDQLVIEGQALRVGVARGVGHDPAPGKAHPVDLEAQLGHQIHILFPVVVVVGGHLVVGDAGLACTPVGGGRTLAPFVVTALHLESTGGCTPKKIVRELCDS